MNIRMVRAISSLAVIVAGFILKGGPAKADNNCYVCAPNNFCDTAGNGEKGSTTCVDPNQGFDPCSIKKDSPCTGV